MGQPPQALSCGEEGVKKVDAAGSYMIAAATVSPYRPCVPCTRQGSYTAIWDWCHYWAYGLLYMCKEPAPMHWKSSMSERIGLIESARVQN